MNILALDLSLTATGICHPDGSTGTFKTGKLRGMERLLRIRDTVSERIEMPGTVQCTDLVVIEGYSYGSKGRAAVSLGELGGIVRMFLWEWGTPYVEIPPSCLKKYLCGKGNAGKDDVLQQAVMRSGRVFGDNNQADAWVMWQMALAHYTPDSPLLVPMPAAHRTALDKIEWTELEGAA